jgi:hypothetical protein
MKTLPTICQRIVAINLPYKSERRISLSRNLGETGIARPDDITWTKALSGDWSPPPPWWQAGNGAWGCLMSHVRAVQDAIMDGVETLCLLEDDVVFHPRATEMLERLLWELPDDWDQVYLGGQNLRQPENLPGKSYVMRAKNINRTHGFILRRKVFARFLQHVLNAPDYITNPGWHIDHQLGAAHEKRFWNTYIPAWWLCGQEAGSSNISGRDNPRKWWQPRKYSPGLPIIHVPATISAQELQASKIHLHPGWHLHQNTFQDVGLNDCVGEPDKLRKWLTMIANESIDLYRLPALQHPQISFEEIQAVWPAGAIALHEANLCELIHYPFNGLFPHPLAQHASRQAFTGSSLVV